jgi:hypothetical protein
MKPIYEVKNFGFWISVLFIVSTLFLVGCTQPNLECRINTDCNAPVCANAFCDAGKCTIHFLHEGASCGYGKECRNHACVEQPPYVPPSQVNSPPPVAPSNPAPVEESPPIFNLNEPMLTGDLVYTINKVAWKKEFTDSTMVALGGDPYAKADGIFLVVFMAVENKGSKPQTISSSNIKIIDQSSREFEESYASQYIDVDSELRKEGVSGFYGSERLNPGLKKSFALAFDVPEGTKGIIQISDKDNGIVVAGVRWS